MAETHSIEPLYSITVAADKMRIHPTRLAAFDRYGLVTPARINGQRKYSDHDLHRLKVLQYLVHELKMSISSLIVMTDMIRAYRRGESHLSTDNPITKLVDSWVE